MRYDYIDFLALTVMIVGSILCILEADHYLIWVIYSLTIPIIMVDRSKRRNIKTKRTGGKK